MRQFDGQADVVTIRFDVPKAAGGGTARVSAVCDDGIVTVSKSTTTKILSDGEDPNRSPEPTRTP